MFGLRGSIFPLKQKNIIKYVYQSGFQLVEGNMEVPASPCSDFRSCFVFAFPKSGSVLLNNVVSGLMQESGVPIIDIPGHFFERGISLRAAVFDCRSLFLDKGYCYSGFRNLPSCFTGIIHKLPGPKILLVRDPRDMLVSYYYSLKFSHQFPKEGTDEFFATLNTERSYAKFSIDEFCILNAISYRAIYDSYHALLDNDSVRIIRYEDIIFDKLQFARDLCQLFSLDIKPDRLAAIASSVDVRRDSELPAEHIRQVAPGDHKRKLKASTIEFLNIAFQDFMQRFGYQP